MSDPIVKDTIVKDIERIGRLDVVPKILDVVCRTTGMGFAAVARVTDSRWTACAVRDEIAFGLGPGGELELGTTICDEIRQSGEPVIISHVAEDPVYRNHHTPRIYGIESYISVPIQHRGAFFGTLCAIDPRPAKLAGPETRALFELFAELIGSHLDAQAKVLDSQAALTDELETSELREQFIAVLGHDLRNPLASIDGAARLLLKTPLNERAATLVGAVQNSVTRMADLIDNVLDLARGRLGGGLGIERRPAPDLRNMLEQVIAEFRIARPERRIEAQLDLPAAVACDSRRIGQLVSNLIANAQTHGAESAPVRVSARIVGDQMVIAVENTGEPIAPQVQARLFQPFTRASVKPHQQGLGLGLYIASEIARAHDGSLTVASDAARTVFTFRMPLERANAEQLRAAIQGAD